MSRFCDLVGCRLPIQQAPLTRVGTPALAAAVADAGGLGMLSIGRQSADAVHRDVDEVLARTTGPVGACFIVRFLDPALVEEVAERLPVVEFFWGWPEPSVVPDGVVTGWQVGSVDEALAAVDSGCGYVVAQGVEAGGHVRGSVALADLVPAVREAVGDVAVVAAGGIGTAADVRAALDGGADAVRVGTRFVAALEADAHPSYVEALIAADGDDTVLGETFSVGWPDAPTRALAFSVAAAEVDGPDPVGHMLLADGSRADLRRRGPTPPTTATTGQIQAMPHYAGMGVGAVTGRAPAADIVAELTDGLAAAS
jgi:NAD(P)H-dependent flavin oxidoreductase YrpB (nitropropane dioxygenase family)